MIEFQHVLYLLFVRIRCDHTEDDSVIILKQWLLHVSDQYSHVDFVSSSDDPGNLILVNKFFKALPAGTQGLILLCVYCYSKILCIDMSVSISRRP